MKVKVEVTQTCIDAAVAVIEFINKYDLHICQNCPIAQAVQGALNIRFSDGEGVGVSRVFTHKGNFTLPNEVINVTMLKHTEWRSVKPFTFEMNEEVQHAGQSSE